MDNKLKQRLIGASVLLALGVIIIPELIKDPFEQTDPAVVIKTTPAGIPENSGLTISLPAAEPSAPEPEASVAVTEAPREITPQPQPETRTPAPAAEAPPPQQPTPSSAPEPAPVTPPTPPEEIQTTRAAPQPAPTPPAPKTEKPATAKAAPRRPAKPIELPKIQLVGRSISSAPPKAQGGWTVQAGSFSNEANARKLSAKLRGQRFPASVERIQVNNRINYRVRVGKQASRTQSEQMLARMQRETGVKGQVMPAGN